MRTTHDGYPLQELLGLHFGYPVGDKYVSAQMAHDQHCFNLVGCVECRTSVWSEVMVEKIIRNHGNAPRAICAVCMRRKYPRLKSFPVSNRD